MCIEMPALSGMPLPYPLPGAKDGHPHHIAHPPSGPLSQPILRRLAMRSSMGTWGQVDIPKRVALGSKK